jgi:hypothetical protein
MRKKYRKNELKTRFQQNFTMGSYGVPGKLVEYGVY